MANEPRGMFYDFGIKIAQGTKEHIRSLRKDVNGFAKDMDDAAKSVERFEKSSTGKFSDAELRQANSSRYQHPRKNDRFLSRYEGLSSKYDPGKADKLLGDVMGKRQETGDKSLLDLEKKIIKMIDEKTAATKKNTVANTVNTKSVREQTKAIGSQLGTTMRHFDRATSFVDVLDNIFDRLVLIAGAYIGITAITSQVSSLYDRSKEYLQLSRTMTPFLGSQTNAMNALDFAQRKVMDGSSLWSGDDFAKGVASLGAVGLDAKKNFQLVSDMAAYAGKSFGDASSAIQSLVQGNGAALEDFGIQEIYLRRMVNTYKHNTPQMRGAVMSFIASQKQFVGSSDRVVKQLDSQVNRTGEIMKGFRLAIMGRPDDETSLISKVTKTFTRINDFLTKHKKKVDEIASGIAGVLKWAWRQIEIVAEKTGAWLKRNMYQADGLFYNFKQKIYSFILWLELSKHKLIRFWNEYGELIKNVASTLFKLWIFKKGVGVATSLLSSVWDLYKGLKGIWDIGKLVGGLFTGKGALGKVLTSGGGSGGAAGMLRTLGTRVALPVSLAAGVIKVQSLSADQGGFFNMLKHYRQMYFPTDHEKFMSTALDDKTWRKENEENRQRFMQLSPADQLKTYQDIVAQNPPKSKFERTKDQYLDYRNGNVAGNSPSQDPGFYNNAFTINITTPMNNASEFAAALQKEMELSEQLRKSRGGGYKWLSK